MCKLLIHRNSIEQRESYFYNKIKKSDYILFGGGQIIQPNDCNVNENLHIITKIAEKLNIPISYNAVGFVNYANQNICDNLLSALSSPQIRYFNSREPITNFPYTNVFANSVVTQQVCDSAVWVCEAYNLKRRRIDKVTTIGINIIYAEAFSLTLDPTSASQVVNKYAQLYSMLTELGYKCFFFTNGVDKDTATLNQVLDKLGLDQSHVKIIKVTTGKHFVKSITKFDFIISSRLHTSICSFSMKIPTLAFVWDLKIQEFYKQIGFPENTLYINQELNKNNIISLIEHSMSMYDDSTKYNNYRNLIIGSIPELI